MKNKTLDYILRATWQAVSRMYNEEANKYDATMATGFALLSIDREEGTPSTALGPRMGMEATSLTRTLKSMEEKGLITRKKNPEDGRGVLIYLTDFGKEKRELSKNTVLKFNESVRQHVSEEKINNFIEVAEIINELIQNKNIFNQQENNELQNVISGLEKEKIRQESEINVKDINYRFLFDENGNNKNQIEILKTHISALIEETARLDKIIFTNKQQLELLNEHLKFVTNEKLNAENTNKKYKILIQEKENVIKLLNVEIERLSNIKWHQKLFGKK